jgi:protein FrlC
MKRGLKVISTTTPSMAYQYQYASQEKYHFNRSIKYFSNGIKATAELGAKIMTVNSGWGYWNEDFNNAFERSKSMISQLCDIAVSNGILLALESLTSVESNIVNNISTAKRMFDEINHPALKIMVDTVATGFAKENTASWFEVFGKDLIHMHFIDGDNRSDAHYIWGDGKYSLEKEIQVLNDNNYRGYLVQEIMDEKYLGNPMSADMENIKKLLKFVDD